MPKKNNLWLLLSLLVILADQITKYLIVQHLQFQQNFFVTSFFNLTLDYNAGASFGFLNNAGGWQIHLFQAISIIISLVLLIWLLRLPPNQKLKALGLSLIIGGAIGNLIDRVRLNYVVDFLDFHINNWHYATFNVADAAVCVGAFFLILSMIWARD